VFSLSAVIIGVGVAQEVGGNATVGVNHFLRIMIEAVETSSDGAVLARSISITADSLCMRDKPAWSLRRSLSVSLKCPALMPIKNDRW
jgi:hypothetical protein